MVPAIPVGVAVYVEVGEDSDNAGGVGRPPAADGFDEAAITVAASRRRSGCLSPGTPPPRTSTRP